MKKIIIVIIFIIFILDIKVNALSLPIDVTADSVIVVNLDKDEVIYEKKYSYSIKFDNSYWSYVISFNIYEN